jgi:hypothetical protein
MRKEAAAQPLPNVEGAVAEKVCLQFDIGDKWGAESVMVVGDPFVGTTPLGG